MRRFNYSSLKDKKWDIEIVNYLALIHEEKGKQSIYLKQKPDELKNLVEIAKIQSTESSNSIEVSVQRKLACVSLWTKKPRRVIVMKKKLRIQGRFKSCS